MHRRAAGFTYVSLIIVVFIIGLVGTTALKLGSMLQRSMSEQELLYIGAAFSDALQSYADATPAGQPIQPHALRDLLKDPRFPAIRRHLRKLYVDPMTGRADWGLVTLGEQGGIIGVYSKSDARLVKVGNFPPRFQGFEGKQHISDWKFTFTGKPESVPVVSAQPTPAAAAAPASGPGAPTGAGPAQPATPGAPTEEPVAPLPPEPTEAPSSAAHEPEKN